MTSTPESEFEAFPEEVEDEPRRPEPEGDVSEDEIEEMIASAEGRLF